ncbi:MAG: adenosylcobinamide-GDP ribazoletransferase [Lachnospiraceae bacterium]
MKPELKQKPGIQIWNSFKIAFSMYSRIPVPKSDWSSDNMRYVMAFFPVIGIGIGAAMMVWEQLCVVLHLQSMGIETIGFLLIPVLLTGGIHMDGLMDTADARSSYQSIEKKLEILKDPRSGAFAILAAIIYFLMNYAVFSVLTQNDSKESSKVFLSIALIYILSRALSGLAIVIFPKAKRDGLASAFGDAAHKRAVFRILLGWILISVVLMLVVSPVYGAASIAAAALVFWYYYWMSVRTFGGITGDLAGWFLQNSELAMSAAIAAVYWIQTGGFIS